MSTLTTSQKKLLDKIVNDKYAVGPFCGMIFNQYQEQKGNGNSQELQTMLIKDALDVRILLENLATCGDGELYAYPTSEQKINNKPKATIKKTVDVEDDLM